MEMGGGVRVGQTDRGVTRGQTDGHSYNGRDGPPPQVSGRHDRPRIPQTAGGFLLYQYLKFPGISWTLGWALFRCYLGRYPRMFRVKTPTLFS